MRRDELKVEATTCGRDVTESGARVSSLQPRLNMHSSAKLISNSIQDFKV